MDNFHGVIHILLFLAFCRFISSFNIGYIGKKWKPQEYCVEKGDWDFETYYVCYGELPNVGWMNIVELGLIPSLDIISAVFLVLTFGLLYREQRQRLFG